MPLAELLKSNAPQYRVVHEPQRNGWNPGMQGPAIYNHTTGNFDAVRALLRRKRRAINWYRSPVYIETSNLFLKSYWDLAPDFFPLSQTKVFHLIRHPLETARSSANREEWLCERGRYLYYRGRDGRRYRWYTLTGLEPIFSSFDLSELTLFQFHLLNWIEVENRAMEYLRRFDMHARCLTLHSPQDLNSPRAAAAILNFVGVDRGAEALCPACLTARRARKPSLVRTNSANAATSLRPCPQAISGSSSTSRMRGSPGPRFCQAISYAANRA